MKHKNDLYSDKWVGETSYFYNHNDVIVYLTQSEQWFMFWNHRILSYTQRESTLFWLYPINTLHLLSWVE